LFAGFDYPVGLTKQRNWVKKAYESGFAMGSDVAGAQANGRPLRIVVQPSRIRMPAISIASRS
jgi:hypothetical protein